MSCLKDSVKVMYRFDSKCYFFLPDTLKVTRSTISTPKSYDKHPRQVKYRSSHIILSFKIFYNTILQTFLAQECVEVSAHPTHPPAYWSADCFPSNSFQKVVPIFHVQSIYNFIPKRILQQLSVLQN